MKTKMSKLPESEATWYKVKNTFSWEERGEGGKGREGERERGGEEGNNQEALPFHSP